MRIGAPSESSTPGGIDSGTLPSFDPRLGVDENRREQAVCQNGTRNAGSVIVGTDCAALRSARGCDCASRAIIAAGNWTEDDEMMRASV
jgi:hypothetical protein